MIKRKDDLERELVFETSDKIYVIQLQTNNIYNSNFNNICNNELTYFCQVKNISKDYHFFSDTQLFKFDINFLTDFITSLENLIKTQDSYKFNFELIKNSENKEVYELELISIYRKAN